VLARYGGDEFPHSLPVTASFGVAAVPDDGSFESDELLAIADERLYAAKRGGKNRVAAVAGA
jgi:GGDEF domain-containing protein